MGKTGPGIPGKGGLEGGRGACCPFCSNLQNGINGPSLSHNPLHPKGLISLGPIPKVFWVAPGKALFPCGLWVSVFPSLK